MVDGEGERYFINRELSKGWTAWQALTWVGARPQALHPMRRGLAHMLNRG